MAPVSLEKLRREAIPLLFFGSVVAIKSYYLTQVLFVEGYWQQMIELGDGATLPAGQLHLVDIASYIAYNVISILFDLLVFVSYLMRIEPREKARGFSQTLYPMATVLLPVTGFTLLSIPAVRATLPGFDIIALMSEYNLSPLFRTMLNIGGLIIGLIGASLSIIALWSLRRSFSLMSEIRELVSSGLYSRIRHPLYMSEIIHILGVAILSGTPAGLWLFGIALAMQVVRAKVEEHKFLQAVPEYAGFRERTGFLWPKLW